MRCLIERVLSSKCVIDNQIHSEINKGFLVYVAFEEGDNSNKIDKSLNKISKLRIFTDSDDKLNLALNDVNGEVMIISSFSLFADLLSGNRPSFKRSLPFDISKPLYDEFILKASKMFKLASGVFGADMKIEAINDGPISVILDL